MPSPSLRSPLYSLRRSKRKGTKRGAAAAASNNPRANPGEYRYMLWYNYTKIAWFLKGGKWVTSDQNLVANLCLS